MNRQQTAIAKRAQIIALHDEGLSSRVIAQRLAVSRTTVQKWIHRHEEIGNLLDAERRPRPRLTSRAQDEAIQQAVRDDPFTNAVSIRKRLRLNVNAQTVRRRLREAGLRHRIPARKERLSEEHRAARLAYARQYVDKGLDFWSRGHVYGRKKHSTAQTMESSTNGDPIYNTR
ncbi:hypothetical protein Pcinc_001898 [Petrolisthes cinctipes]|uniref:Transposase Tc1-like domain-containing protein n=1 Tax=Petrolisthes cinctipes TaxID=88211 RepID=A0AAE1GM18_PETCI|nr:hypothetical protein Pcinc_001898 [Petrolisthes cinctipes]